MRSCVDDATTLPFSQQKVVLNVSKNKRKSQWGGTFDGSRLNFRAFDSWRLLSGSLVQETIRGIKIHVYAKRQTSDSNWEFLRIENKQIKIPQNNSYV